MKNKQLVLRKLEEIRNAVISQQASISLRRSPEELNQQLERIIDKLHEISVLLNTENEYYA